MDELKGISAEDQELLAQFRTSELFKIFWKCSELVKQNYYGALLKADRDVLPVIQGALKGVQAIQNLINYSTDLGAAKARQTEVDSQQEILAPKKATPMKRGSERTTTA